MTRVFLYLFDLLIPKRRRSYIVENLTKESLLNLQTREGLPYREKVVQALVWELKYYANAHASELAGALVAEELLALASDTLGRPLLIPVPMHAARRRERGHNQTEVLCEAALNALGKDVYDYEPRALIRLKATPLQQGLPKHIRLKNVKDSMEADFEAVKGRVCVVVDDVSTTGATFEEAKRALRVAQAREVHCVALAHS